MWGCCPDQQEQGEREKRVVKRGPGPHTPPKGRGAKKKNQKKKWGRQKADSPSELKKRKPRKVGFIETGGEVYVPKNTF